MITKFYLRVFTMMTIIVGAAGIFLSTDIDYLHPT